MSTWTFEGRKDSQLVTSDWNPTNQVQIAGVRTQLIGNVLGDRGYLTEVYRRDWHLDDAEVDQVFQKVMAPGDLSAWHAHKNTVDRLFCAYGRVKVVLFDGREGSSTYGQVAQYRLGTERPALIVIPPGVWHGVQATGTGPSILINIVDKAYSYQDPDHWRMPADCPEIPYRFT